MKLIDLLEKYTAEELLYKGELGDECQVDSSKVEITEIKSLLDGMIGYTVEVRDGRSYLVGFRVFIKPIKRFDVTLYQMRLSHPAFSNEWVLSEDGRTVRGEATTVIPAFNTAVVIEELISVLVKTTKRIHKWNVRRGV